MNFAKFLRTPFVKEHLRWLFLNNDAITGKHGTCLVVGDSMLRHIDETRMPRKFNGKVRPFPGVKISDKYSYLIPILNKKPDYIVFHVGKMMLLMLGQV